jgi:hypothetical protein
MIAFFAGNSDGGGARRSVPLTQLRERFGVGESTYILEINNPATWIYTEEGLWPAIGVEDTPEGSGAASLGGAGEDNNVRIGSVYVNRFCELTDGDLDEGGRYEPKQGQFTGDISPGFTLLNRGGNIDPEITPLYKCVLVLRH